MDRKSDLPNDFGGRVIYVGKIDRGYAEVKLVGVSGNVVKLRVLDYHTNSDETTMSRYGNRSLVDVRQNVTIGARGDAGVVASVNTSCERIFSINDDNRLYQGAPIIL